MLGLSIHSVERTCVVHVTFFWACSVKCRQMTEVLTMVLINTLARICMSKGGQKK